VLLDVLTVSTAKAPFAIPMVGVTDAGDASLDLHRRGRWSPLEQIFISSPWASAFVSTRDIADWI
jgi:hypothetical protein